MFHLETKFTRHFSKLSVLIPVGIALLAALFILVGRRQPPPMAFAPQAVVLGSALARDIVESSEFVAQMEADRIVELKARVSGFLIYKNFAAGDQIDRGRILFQIEPDQYQATLDTAKADVLSARAQFDRATLDFNRISDLYLKHTLPKSDFDGGKAAFEVAEAQLLSAQARETQAQLNLDYASIKAPFDGLISDTPYSEGSLLGPESGVLATVVSVDPILVTFGISSRTITSVLERSEGGGRSLDDWRVRLRLTPDIHYPQAGRLVYMAPTVDPLTDTVKFKAKFANPDGELRPGQIVTAIMESAAPRRRLAVPKGAVLTDPEGRFVYTVKEVPEAAGRPAGLVTERRPIVLDQGETDGEYFVREGLAEGDRFIVKGLLSGGSTLTPGAPVRLVTPEEAAEEAAGGAAPGAAPAGGENGA
ncbi:MAG: efflux RND transporter periplasmic adaptor subunit [Candidatus Adiutrix sp.]|jgi:membrane fusion protein (multidrug efflux system)|nr:efflux RND transporter periplasmic adaptor subunit [Candidatus Adiutrix sp.]